jgi:hypothetical protein
MNTHTASWHPASGWQQLFGLAGSVFVPASGVHRADCVAHHYACAYAAGYLVAAQGLGLHVRLLIDAAAGADKSLRQAVAELERVELRAARDLQAPAAMMDTNSVGGSSSMAAG